MIEKTWTLHRSHYSSHTCNWKRSYFWESMHSIFILVIIGFFIPKRLSSFTHNQIYVLLSRKYLEFHTVFRYQEVTIKNLLGLWWGTQGIKHDIGRLWMCAHQRFTTFEIIASLHFIHKVKISKIESDEWTWMYKE